MTRRMVPVLTVAVCLLSAIAETILGVTTSTRLSARDMVIVLFIVGPYLLLASLTWCHRGLWKGSWTLLAIAVIISASGLYIFGNHSYRWHTDPQFRKVQSMAIFFVPLVQWAIVLLVGISSVVRWQTFRNELAGTGAEQRNGNEGHGG